MSKARVSAEPVPDQEQILTPEALAFVADLQRTFGARRDGLLADRQIRREQISRTGLPAYEKFVS
jgi:malate synthase